MSFSLLSNIPSPSFIQTIKNKIEPLNFPECPGVYVMVNQKGEISYTGKAKNLRDRIYAHVKSSHNLGVEDDIAKQNIKEIMVFCCDTELDAIILERYFIQSNIYCGKHNKQYVSSSLSDFRSKKRDFSKRIFNENVTGIEQEEIDGLKREVEDLRKIVGNIVNFLEEDLEMKKEEREHRREVIDMIKRSNELIYSSIDMRFYARKDFLIERMADMQAKQVLDDRDAQKRLNAVEEILLSIIKKTRRGFFQRLFKSF